METDTILAIFSYDAMDSWSESVLDGILSIIPQSNKIQYHIEYLDTRNAVSREYLSIFTSLLIEKHGKHLPSVIISVDDAAFTFARRLRKELKTETPLLFCGVNSVEPARWEESPSISGVSESIDIAKTVNRALSLFPETKKIAVVASSFGTGSINAEIYFQQSKQFAREVETIPFIDKSTADLEKLLPQLQEDTLVLRLDNIASEAGDRLSVVESISFLSQTSPRPVLTCWDFDMGKGALGGYVVSGFAQGTAVAKLALPILTGRGFPPEVKGVESPNVPMFDYQQLIRFGVDPESVPDKSLLVNKPDTLFKQYRPLIISGALSISLLCILVAGMTVNLFGRKKAERALKKSEERLRLAMDASSDGLWDWDLEENTLYWSPRAYTMLGYRVNQFPVDFTTWKELIHPEDRELATGTVLKSIEEGRGNFEMEFRYRNISGKYQWIAGKGKIVAWNDEGKVKRVTGTQVDISARKRTEEALQHSLREKEVLLRELYHRTKNNMQVVASLLSLRRASMPDSDTAEILRGLETKVFTMGLVHQMLYQSKNLDRIDLGEYIREICSLTGEAYDRGAARISVSYKMEKLEVGLDTAIPLGLVVNELFTNAVKYAFSEATEGNIDIILESRGHLEIGDNGKGISCREEELYLGNSLGMPTVKELVEHQLDGTITCVSAPGEGTRWLIEFPTQDADSPA